jgi:hypothetical protein
VEVIITSVITSLAAGALAKAKRIGVAAITGAYEGLKKAVIEELDGKTGAVQLLEERPESDAARSMLAEELGSRNITQSAQLNALAESLESAISAAKTAGVPGAGDINFEDVRGKINATVSHLVATGSIKFGSVIAETGDATVKDLRAGSASEEAAAEGSPPKKA